jgi:hypothetical protein
MNNNVIVGFFSEENDLVNAIHRVKEKSLEIEEIYMPYPVHEALEAVGKKSKLPTAAYFLGLFAIITVLSFLYYTSVIDWPVMYGGKPFNSFPSFIVVTIVLTIFTITIGSLFLFSVRAKLFPGQKENQVDVSISDNEFAMVINVDKNSEKISSVEEIFRECKAIRINNQ